MTKEEITEKPQEKENPKPESFLTTWSWRVSGFIVWWLVIESILFNFFSYRPIGLPPVALAFPTLHFVSLLFPKEKGAAAGLIGYILFYPVIVAILIFFAIFNAFSSAFATIGRIIDLAVFLSSSKGLVIFFIWSTITLILPIYHFDQRISYFVLISAAVLLPLSLLISARFSLNPLIPAETFVMYAHKFFNGCINKYYEFFMKEKLESANPNDWKTQESTLNKAILILKNFPIEKHREVPKKYVVLLFSVFFILIFVTATVLVGALLYSGNHVIAANPNSWSDIPSGGRGLFETLPLTASYFACLFHSFTMIAGCQDFTLQNTSVIGQTILICSTLWNAIFFILIISSFFTVLSLEKEVLTRLDEFSKAATELIENWLEEIHLLQARSVSKTQEQLIQIPESCNNEKENT